MRLLYLLLDVLIFILVILDQVAGSQGDSSPFYQNCLKTYRETCPESSKNDSSSNVVSLIFPSYEWPCEQECRYKCMWEQEAIRRQHNYHRVQYFGKWPFVRFAGVQEPMSTLFSLAHLFFHGRALLFRRHLVAPASLPPAYRVAVYFEMIFGTIAWCFSTVFHWRDNWVTERLDYNGVTLLMTSALLLVISRLTISLAPRRTHQVTTMAGILIGAFLIHHFYYMNFIHFDYGYNVKMNITIGIVQFLLWMVWVAQELNRKSAHESTRKVAWMALRQQIAITCTALFEINDFPPLWDHLDAHSLWHGFSIPLARYEYIIRRTDAEALSNLKKQTHVL